MKNGADFSAPFRFQRTLGANCMFKHRVLAKFHILMHPIVGFARAARADARNSDCEADGDAHQSSLVNSHVYSPQMADEIGSKFSAQEVRE
jgi:hypothetical protein